MTFNKDCIDGIMVQAGTVGAVLAHKQKRNAATPRPLYTIANEIEREWIQGKGVSPYARPYLDAMKSLNAIGDAYYADSGVSIVLYFLANAGSWRGDVARRVKAELKALAQ